MKTIVKSITSEIMKHNKEAKKRSKIPVQLDEDFLSELQKELAEDSD